MSLLKKIFNSKPQIAESQIKNSSASYILRKNKFFYNENEFHTGKATEVIDVNNNFSKIKELFLEKTLEDINRMTSNGFNIQGSKMKDVYKYFLYRNVIKKENQLTNLKDKDNLYKNIFNSNNYSMRLDSIEEVDIFNHFHPINSHEILITNEPYLLAPKWNKKYFDLIKQEIPSSNLNYNFDQVLDDWFISKGLYVDELDFWTNITQDINGFGSLKHYYSIDFNLLKNEDKEINWLKKGFIIENDKLGFKSLDNPVSYYWMNNLLSEPPISFEKVSIDNYNKHQIESYKNTVIQTYLDTRFTSGGYETHQQMMTEKKNDFWTNLFISEKLAKSIIENNLDEITTKSNELMKKY